MAELFGESPVASQVQRLDFARISAAVTVLRTYLELMGKPIEMVEDPVLLEIAYEVVQGFGGEAPADNVLDLTKVLADRMRGGNVERSIRGTGKAVGGSHS